VHPQPDAVRRPNQRLPAPVAEVIPLGIANARVVRTIKTRPVDRLDADRAAMPPLPPIAPMAWWVNRVRLGRDYYIRLDSNDYAAHRGPPRRPAYRRADPAAALRLIIVDEVG
jgi:hypothetical protein